MKAIAVHSWWRTSCCLKERITRDSWRTKEGTQEVWTSLLRATSKRIKGSGCESMFEKTKSLTRIMNALQGKDTGVWRRKPNTHRHQVGDSMWLWESNWKVSGAQPNSWGPRELQDLVTATHLLIPSVFSKERSWISEGSKQIFRYLDTASKFQLAHTASM